MDITRNLSGTRALVVGAGLALALAMGAAPTTALAEGRVGTTDVTIRTEIDNITFKAPTVIPFVASADGTLQTPTDNTLTIDNLSAYGIHVTNMKVTAEDTWNIAADAKKDTAQNCWSGKDKLDFLLRILKRIAAHIPLETCSPGWNACAPYCNRALCT